MTKQKSHKKARGKNSKTKTARPRVLTGMNTGTRTMRAKQADKGGDVNLQALYRDEDNNL